MKKWIIKDINREKRDLIFILADKAKIDVFNITRLHSNILEYPHLTFDGFIISGCSSIGDDLFGFEEVCDMLINYRTPVKIGLTSDYIGEIKQEGIQVGCQLITYEKFDELSEAVNKFRNQNI